MAYAQVESKSLEWERPSPFRLWLSRITERFSIPLALLPVMLVLVVLFLGGLISAVMQSLGYFPIVGLTQITLANYRKLILGPDLVQPLLFTFYVAGVSTIVSAAISTYLALCIRNLSSRWRFYKTLYKLPLLIPYLLVVGMAMTSLSGGGLLARVCYALGIIHSTQDFPPLIFDRPAFGVMLIYVWKFTSFMTLVIYSVLIGLDRGLEDAAVNLGASKWSVFRFVLFPLMLPGIISSSLICFAFAFGNFEVPWIAGPSFPTTLAVDAYKVYTDVAKYSLKDIPYPMAMFVVVALVALVILVLYRRVTERFKTIS